MASYSISFYEYSIGSYTKALKVLLRILTKASTHPDAASLLDARLAPDMWTLAHQVQIAAAFAVALAEALVGAQLVAWNERRDSFGGDDKCWADVLARVEKALAVLAEVDPAQADSRVAGGEGLKLPMRVGSEFTFQVPAADCVLTNGLPNVFFHVYTAYAILRSRGVEIGKKDVLVPFLPGYVADEMARMQMAETA